MTQRQAEEARPREHGNDLAAATRTLAALHLSRSVAATLSTKSRASAVQVLYCCIITVKNRCVEIRNISRFYYIIFLYSIHCGSCSLVSLIHIYFV